MRRLASALIVLLALCSTPALAWEDTGHRLVSTVAAEAFPAELPGFLRTPHAIRTLGELGREADRSRGAGQPHDADLDPAHFLDYDDQGRILGGPRLDALPPTRAAYEQALQAAGTDSWKAGYLPYAIAEGWQQLVKDFAYWRAARLGERSAKTSADRAWFTRDRILREQLILRDLGYWSHFVADGSNPMHVSVHYNGWGDYPNPQGYTQDKIHAPFEGAFVRDNASAAAVRTALAPYRPCDCTPMAATQRYLLASGAKVEPLYALWKQGGFQRGDPRGTAFVVERLAAGAAQLRDFVVDAWRAAPNATVGYPPVTLKSLEDEGGAPIDRLRGRG